MRDAWEMSMIINKRKWKIDGNDNPANRWVLNLTALMILLPIFLGLIIQIQGFKLALIPLLFKRGFSTDLFGLLALIITFACLIASLVLVLRRSRLRLAVLALFLCSCSIGVSVSILGNVGKVGGRELIIHGDAPGIDVFCNDVYLGKSPLKIFESEFHQAVKPWHTPPRQKMFLGDEFIDTIKNQRYWLKGTELQWSYIPYNFFYIPRNHRFRYHMVDWVRKERFDNLYNAVKSGFWWRFEEGGCTGFTLIQDMELDHSSNTGPLTIRSAPYLTYPALQPYLNHLMHDLRRSNYTPSTAWRRRVASSSTLLFRPLYRRGQRDSRVMQALELAIQTEFDISPEMSPVEWEAVIDEIMLRVKKRRAFHTPSPESMALDLIMQHNMELIENRFFRMLNRPYQAHEILSLGLYHSPIHSRSVDFLPFKYVVSKYQPSALLNRLVYESRRGEPFVSMVASYSGQESSRLTRQFLDNASSLNAVRFATQLENPLREPELRRFMLRHVQSDEQGGEKRMLKFIETRLNRSLTMSEADSLVKWVANTAPLPDRKRLQFLARIDSRFTYRHIRRIIQQTPKLEMVVVEELKRHPNPSLDLFLIELYHAKSAKANSSESVSNSPPRDTFRGVDASLILAMVLCDTPRMRKCLERLWHANHRNKVFLLIAIEGLARHYPHLHRWTTLISAIEDNETRLAAIPVLNLNDTPESSKVLADWALSSDARVKADAAEALAKYHERSRNAEALLAGSIKPDDLLVGHTAYVWDGENYVPEETAVEDK